MLDISMADLQKRLFEWRLATTGTTYRSKSEQLRDKRKNLEKSRLDERKRQLKIIETYEQRHSAARKAARLQAMWVESLCDNSVEKDLAKLSNKLKALSPQSYSTENQ